MKIHLCHRCEGCGHVTGAYRWEIAWTRWAPESEATNATSGFLKARVCPDCAGTGALIDTTDAGLAHAAGAGGQKPQNPYAHHVALVLQAQAMGSAN